MLHKALQFPSRQVMLGMWNLNRCKFWKSCTELLHVAQDDKVRTNLYIALFVKIGVKCFIIHSQISLEAFQSSSRHFNFPMKIYYFWHFILLHGNEIILQTFYLHVTELVVVTSISHFSILVWLFLRFHLKFLK